MQFEVPQFIEIEDKIFGPFTWRQFLYLGGGVMITVVLFITTPFIIFAFIGIPLLLLALALAFYPVNNRPFSHFLEAMYTFLSRKKIYHWQQKQDVVYKEDPSVSTPRSGQMSDALLTKKDIASLARRLELDAMQRKQ